MSGTDTRQKNESLDFSTGVALNVLVVVGGAFPSARMIYEIPFRVLAKQNFSWRIVSEYQLKIADLTDKNVLILYRCFQDSTLSLARFARHIQKKVIYELDDDLLEPPEDKSWGERYRTSHLPQILKMFLVEADLIKAGSPELERRLTERGYPAVYQPYTAKICPLPPQKIGPPYRVGYFGSPHHQDDIEMIFPALQTVQESLPDQIEFEFIGCYPQEWRQLRARIFQTEPDYEKFLELLAGRHWDLGLAPLRPIAFNEAKSNSKFRDLTAAGIVGIYSDLTPYRASIANAQNGWLVKESNQEWFDAIRNALLCSERIQMLHQARNLLQTAFSPETVARNWLTLFGKINNDDRGEKNGLFAMQFQQELRK